jgi:ubiquitin related modifier 1
MANLKLRVDFSGGLELLFSNQRTNIVTIPSTVPEGDREGKPVDLNFLIHWLKDHLLKERPELFIEGGTVYVGSYL